MILLDQYAVHYISINFLLSNSVNEYSCLLSSNCVTSGLSKNHFSGTIPHQFGRLMDLNILNLRHNNLTGTIPAVAM